MAAFVGALIFFYPINMAIWHTGIQYSIHVHDTYSGTLEYTLLQ